MSKEDLYRFEKEQSLAEIADFLENVAQNLRNGTLSFSDELELSLPERVVLDIDVDRRNKPDVTATSVEIELKWAE